MQYEAQQVVIATGEVVSIRPAHQYDVERIRDMYARSSEYSIYLRYLRHTQPTLDEIESMVNLLPSQGKVLVATVESEHGELVVGYAYYVVNVDLNSFVAEPAIMIEDNFQGLGLGHALCAALIHEACQQKVQAFEMTVSANNNAMMGVIRKSGLHYTQSFLDGARSLLIALNPLTDLRFVSEDNVNRLISFLIPEPA